MLISRAGVSLTIWLGVFTVLTSAILGLRFWAIKVQKRPYRPDDFMVVFAWINTTCLACLCWWAIANGLGAHTVELDPYELGVQYKLLLAAGVLWLLGTVFCKLSILWLYTVIFTTKIFKWAAWFMMGVVGGYGVAFLCVFLTNCHPISFPWHPVPGGGCRELAVEELTSVSVNMLIDTLIVLLPMRSLWGLQMAARNKIAISFLFSLGFLVVGLMAWRIQITNQGLTQADFVYGLANISLVSFLELWMGMIIVCVPTLAPLFAKYIKPAVSRITGSSKKSREQPGEAENTIGGGRNYKRKNYGKLGRDISMELEEGKNLSHASATSTFEEDEPWVNEPNAIAVRHDIHVYNLPQSPQR